MQTGCSWKPSRPATDNQDINVCQPRRLVNDQSEAAVVADGTAK